MERIIGFKANTFVFVDENNMMYAQKSEHCGIKYLQCQSKNCESRVSIVLESEKVTVTKPHADHPDERLYIAELRFRQMLREAVIKNPEVPSKVLFDQIQASYLESGHVTFKSVANLLAKTRGLQLPPIPSNLIELGNSLQTNT